MFFCVLRSLLNSFLNRANRFLNRSTLFGKIWNLEFLENRSIGKKSGAVKSLWYAANFFLYVILKVVQLIVSFDMNSKKN